MGEAGTVLVLVASLWASVNAIVAGYEAVNRTRERIILGEDEGRTLSVEHRRLMFRNDWIPMKLGLSLASLAFALIIVFLPTFLEMPPILGLACYVIAVLPFFSFLAFFGLGIVDGLFMRRVLDRERRAAEAGSDLP